MQISIELYVVLVIGGIFSGIFSGISLLLSIQAYCNVKALEKSTHSVQYMPIDHKIDKDNEEYIRKNSADPFEDLNPYSTDDENWASSEEAISKENNLYKKELEDEMPQFATTDKDRKILSL